MVVDRSRADRVGWCSKQGALLSHRRWLILCGSHLFYYCTDSPSEEPRGSIELEPWSTVEVDASKRRFTFSVRARGREGSSKVYSFCVGTLKDATEWVDAIARNIAGVAAHHAYVSGVSPTPSVQSISVSSGSQRVSSGGKSSSCVLSAGQAMPAPIPIASADRASLTV
eukprot:m51a1_g6166 hypothetical protein (169) ;mRNA; r:347474-348558